MGGVGDDLESVFDKAEANISSSTPKKKPANKPAGAKITEGSTGKKRKRSSKVDRDDKKALKLSLKGAQQTKTGGDSASSSHLNISHDSTPISKIPPPPDSDIQEHIISSPTLAAPDGSKAVDNPDLLMINKIHEHMDNKIRSSTRDIASGLPSASQNLPILDLAIFARDDALLHAARSVALAERIEYLLKPYEELKSRSTEMEAENKGLGLQLKEANDKFELTLKELQDLKTASALMHTDLTNEKAARALEKETYDNENKNSLEQIDQLRKDLKDTQNDLEDAKTKMESMIDSSCIAEIKNKNTVATLFNVYIHNHKSCPQLRFDFLKDKEEEVMTRIYKVASRAEEADTQSMATDSKINESEEEDEDDDEDHDDHDDPPPGNDRDDDNQGGASANPDPKPDPPSEVSKEDTTKTSFGKDKPETSGVQTSSGKKVPS